MLRSSYLAGPQRDLQEVLQGCLARDQDPEFTTGGGAARREEWLDELSGRAGNYLSHRDQAAGWAKCPDKSHAASLQNQARNWGIKGSSKKLAASSPRPVLILNACFCICCCFITDLLIVSRFLMNSNSIYSQ